MIVAIVGDLWAVILSGFHLEYTSIEDQLSQHSLTILSLQRKSRVILMPIQSPTTTARVYPAFVRRYGFSGPKRHTIPHSPATRRTNQ